MIPFLFQFGPACLYESDLPKACFLAFKARLLRRSLVIKDARIPINERFPRMKAGMQRT